ncbi:hypothetical protein DYB26_009230, partial [Aphanomyces astaci]
MPPEGLTTMHIGYIIGVSVCAVGIAAFLFLQSPTRVESDKDDTAMSLTLDCKKKSLFPLLDSRRAGGDADLTFLDTQQFMTLSQQFMTMPRHIPLLEDGQVDMDTLMKAHAQAGDKAGKLSMVTPLSYTFSSLSVSDSEATRDESIICSRPGYDATFMKEGYLQKKGQLLKGWKKRWFVCDGRSLSYYSTKLEKKPNAVIPLESATVQDGGTSETWNSPRIYLTDGTSGTMYCLSGDEGDVVSQWLDVLDRAVKRIHEKRELSQPVGVVPRSKSHITPFDEEEGRQKPIMSEKSPTRKAMLASSFSDVNATKPRGSSDHAASPFMSSKPGGTHLPTTIRLENELSTASELLNCLLFNKTTTSDHTSSPIQFHYDGVVDGVRISSAVDPTTGKHYARGSSILPVAPSLALRILLDHHRRHEWDSLFPHSTHVATYGGSTDLIHLCGGDASGFFDGPLLASASSPVLPAAAAAIVSGVLAPSDWLVHAAAGAVVAGVAASVDWRPVACPRDLLLLRHVYEAMTLSSSSMTDRSSCQHLLDAVGVSSGANAMIIAEMSVANELKPVVRGVVRAHIGVSGWLVEPLDTESTLVTYVTDLNVKGWIPSYVHRAIHARRMRCLAAISAFVSQAKVLGPTLGYDDDDDYNDEVLLGANNSSSSNILGGRSSAALGMRGDDGNPAAAFHPRDYFRMVVQVPSGGVKLTDKDIAKKQNGVLMEVIKNMGTKLLDGKSAVSLSLPVRIFEPRTMLDRLVDLYLYAPNYLSAANDATDMVERFKLTMAFAVAGWHHTVGCMKPFSPILGETMQAEFVDGATVHCEHASHHPPISYAQIVGPKYKVHSYSILNGSLQTNCIVQVQQGPVRVTFLDGAVIEFTLPAIRMGGFLWGDRVVELVGSIHFQDKANGISCELKLNPDEKKGMFASNKVPTDRFRGTLVSKMDDVCEVSGSWLEELRFGDHVYWNLQTDRCAPVVRLPDDKVLPSDSRNRQDLKFLGQDDLDEAQEWKLTLEKLQRADRTKRKEGRRPNHWTVITDGEYASCLSSRPGYDPSYMKEGYLQKQGQLLKGWKKRWFVCDGRTLSYFHTNLDKTPSAIIPLETATVQDGGTSERWNGPRIYVTDTISGVVYCVSGEDSTSVLQWLVILQRAVQRICDAKAEHINAPLRQKSHSVPADLKATDTAFGGSLRRPTASVSASNVLSNTTASSKRSKSTSHVTSKPVNLSTTLRLENDLAVAKALLGTLLFQHSRFHVMSNVHHHPNLRIGFVTDPVTGKAYLRGSIVLDVVPALALRLLLDPQKRSEWDVHFPLASHVASYGGATDLLHLASTSSVPFMPAAEYVTLLVVVACAAVAALAMSSQSLMHAANAAVVGALLGSLLVITVSPQTLWRHAIQRRDLLLLRHVFEAQSSANSVTLSTNDAMVVAELSVVNELKPVTQSTIRGRVSISGWLVQSLGTDATLVTHVVDNVNLNGWLPAAVSERVARGRLSKCLPALASFVRHAQTQGSHCGYHDDLFDIDATAVIDEEEDEDDATDS